MDSAGAAGLESAQVSGLPVLSLPGDKSTPDRGKSILQSLSLSHEKLSSDKVRERNKFRAIEVQDLRRRFEWIVGHPRLERWDTLTLNRIDRYMILLVRSRIFRQ